ncbi:3-carboxy-cis,cis-muconate cycloisomerase [Roseateles sp. YR242]|nr:3-carboxy-cis,cis-muconate cycloisomerase [Roseateles sp. YR242]
MFDRTAHVGMFESFITAHWFHSKVKAIWSDRATLQAWLTVESALAHAQARSGLIPEEAARVIETRADASLFNISQLAEQIAFAQHPLVPVLHQLETLCGEPAAGYIHWGATTQNIFDTATSLQMMQTHCCLVADVDAAIAALSTLAETHRDTPMAGRTHGQHALPMTLGFKLAGWIAELARDRQRLDERVASSFTVSMGGAIGTYAATGAPGREVEARLAERLGLQPSVVPSRSSFDRVADYVNSLGLLAGTAQRIAQEMIFLQRTEIGEVSEAFHLGKVGSSTMAQKRNPTTAQLLSSLSRMLRARVPVALESMVRMDEGDAAVTNVTDTLMPEIAILAASMAQTLRRLVEGLTVHPGALARNLSLTDGLIASEAAMMRLTSLIGRHHAHHVLYDAVHQVDATESDLLERIARHPLLAGQSLPDGFAAALDPAAYTGESAAIVEDVIRQVRGERG